MKFVIDTILHVLVLSNNVIMPCHTVQCEQCGHMLVQSLLPKYMYFQNFTNFGPITITYVQYMYYEYINFVHNDIV